MNICQSTCRGDGMASKRIKGKRIHPSLLTEPMAAVDGESVVTTDSQALVEQTNANSWDRKVLQRPVRRIAPEDNVLRGGRAICAYLKVASLPTIERWVIGYGFPAIKTPDGVWMSTTTAIDQWVWIAAELEADKRLDARTRKVALSVAFGAERNPNKQTYTSSDIERAARAGTNSSVVIRRSIMRRLTSEWMREGHHDNAD